MSDWNVIASINGQHFRQGCELLSRFGPVRRTEYFNVVTLRSLDPEAMLEALALKWAEDPGLFAAVLSRVVPLAETFRFQSPEEFDRKAEAVAERWLPRLEGAAFYVRMHRRGFGRRMSSQAEERALDQYLLARLAESGKPGRIRFEDPDYVVAVETLGQEAGLSLWSREQLARYPFLKLD